MTDQPRALWLGALGVLLTSAVLMHAPGILFNVGVPNNDFDAHYRWAVQFGESLRGGDLYPHWMWRGNYGLGEVALLFYSPLFYYLSGAVRLLTPNTWEAMRIVFVLSTLLTGFYGWRLLRLFSTDGYALVGAVLLQWAPMIFMLFYYFDGFPWAVGFAALVALTYYAVRPGAFERWVDLPASLAIAALVLTHIVSALMALICFSFMCLWFVRGSHRDVWAWRRTVSWFVSAGFRSCVGGILSGPRRWFDGPDIARGLDDNLYALECFCLPHRNQPPLRHALVFLPMDGAGGRAARSSCRNLACTSAPRYVGSLG